MTEHSTAPEQPRPAAAPEQAGERSEQPGKRPRGRETSGDMVRSMALVLVVVAVVVLLTLRDQPDQTVREVGFSQELQVAREHAPYDVLAPVGLPSAWKVTSVQGGSSDAGSVTWHLGLMTPDGEYAGVEQSGGPVKAFLDRHVAGARPAGKVTVSGAVWERVDGGHPEDRALVQRGDDVTTLVTGSAGFAELRELAGSLHGG